MLERRREWVMGFCQAAAAAGGLSNDDVGALRGCVQRIFPVSYRRRLRLLRIIRRWPLALPVASAGVSSLPQSECALGIH